MGHKKHEEVAKDKVFLAKEHEDVCSLWEKDPLLMQKIYWSYEAVPLLYVKELDTLNAEEVSNVPYLQEVYKKLQRKSHKALKSPVYYQYGLSEIQSIPDGILESSNSARILLQVNDFLIKSPARLIQKEGEVKEHYALVERFAKFIQKNAINPLDIRQLQQPTHRLYTQFMNVSEGLDCRTHWGMYESLRQQLGPYLAHLQKTRGSQVSAASEKKSNIVSAPLAEKILQKRMDEMVADRSPKFHKTT